MPEERGFNPLAGIGDKLEELGAKIERRIQIKLALRVLNVTLSDLKDLDSDNAALYADLQAELAARK